MADIKGHFSHGSFFPAAADKHAHNKPVDKKSEEKKTAADKHAHNKPADKLASGKDLQH